MAGARKPPPRSLDLGAVAAALVRAVADAALDLTEGERADSGLRIRSASLTLALAVRSFDARAGRTLVSVEHAELAELPAHAVSSLTIELATDLEEDAT